MCGILFSNDPQLSEERFKKSLDKMNHRGPDYSGFLESGKFKLGHTRLKIIDLDDRSNQPMLSSCKRYAIIFNGEIYNFQELKKKHALKTKTSSDTEILLLLYIKLKDKILNELNGMFAFIILDTSTGSYFVARDRLGVKPLYYCRNKENIYFSSEISPLLDFIKSNEIDNLGLRQYKKFRTFFNQRTLYKLIKVFPSGYFFDGRNFIQYWQYQIKDEKQLNIEELYDLLLSAIELRCLSDVPVGSFLSGGLDSTLITALSGIKRTWSVGFADLNEFNWAEIASKNLDTKQTNITINNEEFIELSKNMINKRKEPLSVPNETLLFKLSKKIKPENTVVLSGEGADELFFGYSRIFSYFRNNEFDLRHFDKLYSYGSHDDEEIIEDVISPYQNKYSNAIDIIASFFQTAHLHGLLRRLDNSSMFASIEARTPFVDYRIVELMSGVRYEDRVIKDEFKFPLKKIADKYTNLPNKLIYRPKVGFPVPLNQIFELGQLGNGYDYWLKFNLNQLGIN